MAFMSAVVDICFPQRLPKARVITPDCLGQFFHVPCVVVLTDPRVGEWDIRYRVAKHGLFGERFPVENFLLEMYESSLCKALKICWQPTLQRLVTPDQYLRNSIIVISGWRGLCLWSMFSHAFGRHSPNLSSL